MNLRIKYPRKILNGRFICLIGEHQSHVLSKSPSFLMSGRHFVDDALTVHIECTVFYPIGDLQHLEKLLELFLISRAQILAIARTIGIVPF